MYNSNHLIRMVMLNMFKTEPLNSVKSLREQAYENIRESIIMLQLKPGQLVHENELATTLGISRTPIRDAFHLLIAEGLIEILPQRTKQVAFISVTKLMESNTVRLSLENTAFQAVAANWDETHPVYIRAKMELDELLQRQADAAKSQDTASFLQLDEAFHKKIMQLTGNNTLIEVVEQVRSHLNRYRFLAMKELVLTKNLVKEHREILACLQAQDQAGVKQTLATHLGKIKLEIPSLREKFTDFFRD